MNTKKVEKLIKELLIELGEDPNREGLQNTPQRVSQMLKDLTKGYHDSSNSMVNNSVYTQKTQDMIILKDIELYSLCEHHMLPFFGKCHIGYIPTDKIIGISKIAQIIDIYAKRLQLQERLTQEIAKTLEETLTPLGVGVIIEAQHLCMMMRGVEKQHSKMITSTVLGSFRSNPDTRKEFISFIDKHR